MPIRIDYRNRVWTRAGRAEGQTEILMMAVAPEGAEAQGHAAAELANGGEHAVVAVVDGAASGDQKNMLRGGARRGIGRGERVLDVRW
jgi:hypothetical protein